MEAKEKLLRNRLDKTVEDLILEKLYVVSKDRELEKIKIKNDTLEKNIIYLNHELYQI